MEHRRPLHERELSDRTGRVSRTRVILGLAAALALALIPGPRAGAGDGAGAGQAANLPPDSLAAEFQASLRGLGWRAAAARMHPDALRRFRDLLDMLVEVDSTAVLETLFGGMSLADYRRLTPTQVFVRALGTMRTRTGGLLHAIVVREVEVIGAVTEPPDRAYAVYRSTAQLSGAEPEIRVMTLKRTGAGWGVLDSPELDVIRESLRGLPRRYRATHPPP